MICITAPTPRLIAMIIIRPPHDCPDDLQSIIVQEPSVCLDETSGATLIARAHVPKSFHGPIIIIIITFTITKFIIIIKLWKVDTPGFGDFVDNSNCWEPVRKSKSSFGLKNWAISNNMKSCIKTQDIMMCFPFPRWLSTFTKDLRTVWRRRPGIKGTDWWDLDRLVGNDSH